MLPLSIYLTRRATKDRGLFEFDSILDPLKKLFRIKPKDENDPLLLSYKKLETYNEDKLVDVIKNFESYDYDETVKPRAYAQLKRLGLNTSEIVEKGINIDKNFIASEKVAKDFNDYSLTTFVSYAIAAVFIVLHFVFKNNKLPELAVTILNLGLIALLFFAIYFVVSSIKISKFFSTLKESDKKINYFLLLIGLPFYALTYFLLKNRVKEELSKSSIKNIK
jgi:lipopolysaccharide export system permease protein